MKFLICVSMLGQLVFLFYGLYIGKLMTGFKLSYPGDYAFVLGVPSIAFITIVVLACFLIRITNGESHERG